MTEKEVFDQLVRKVNDLKKIIKKRHWNLKKDLILEGPATDKEINQMEKLLGIDIPQDYKTLFRFSKRAEFSYQFEEDLPEEFSDIFSGEIYWNLSTLPEQMENFKGWIEASTDPDYNDPEAIEITSRLSPNKIPLLEVYNGDVIVIGNEPSEVIYLSHDGDDCHGMKLGDNLWQFLEFHSRIGFAGSEGWQLTPFYNFESGRIETHGEVAGRFTDWLNQ
ncbi:MAG: SMI1/KNR4 family protein [Roseivirga sp.]|nr:SMI1/KNR4 family protein [Roseivirga sp.]